MRIKDLTKYIINKYNDEILVETYDKKNMKKNQIKNEQKLMEIENEVPKLFAVDNLITTFKPGPEYNRSENPWIQIHDKKIKTGTKGVYIGISFNKETNELEIWLGFGKNKKRKKEIIQLKEEHTKRLKKIEPMLKRGFKFSSIPFSKAIFASKSIPVNTIEDDEVLKDLKYLGNIYIKYLNKSSSYNISINDNIYVSDNIEKDAKICGENIIFVGPPGCGKSYEVKKEYLALKDKKNKIIYDENGDMQLIDDKKYEIVVFYPEYTTSDFIGSVMPVTNNDEIKYEFVPGPFSKILKRAIYNPQSNFYLIIEEINRGNAAAIFGDIFVLLDRGKDNMGPSTYEISNDLVANYVYNNPNKKIKIPENLSIIATMNSTDQNTIPLDSAFKRRWEIVWVTDDGNYEIDKLYIKGFSNITWGNFRKTINNKILQSQNDIYSFEDKTLSAYFINESYLSKEPNDNEKDRNRFVCKVLTHMFLDTCKYNKNLLFKENINCVDTLIKESKKGIDNILNDDLLKEIKDEYNRD